MLKNKIKELNQLINLLPLVCYQQLKDEIILVVLNHTILITLKILKLHIGTKFNLLSCISGVDLLHVKYRFSIVYELLSLTFNSRIRLKVFVDELTTTCSAISVYVNANWWEREIWDLYGLYFEKHPDLRRILTDYGFEGYPMRKDFPLYGYVEVRYDTAKKRIIVEPIMLSQEYRFFTFETPW